MVKSQIKHTKKCLPLQINTLMRRTHRKPKSTADKSDLGSDLNEETSRPNEVTAPVEPEELLDDDLDLDGFDDLGLDDEEEEKRGLFSRKDKEESKPEKKLKLLNRSLIIRLIYRQMFLTLSYETTKT